MRLTVYGAAVGLMALLDMLESRASSFTCAVGAAARRLAGRVAQRTWPFEVVEAERAVVALRAWIRLKRG